MAPAVTSTLFIAADGVAEIDAGWHLPYSTTSTRATRPTT